MNKTIIRYQQGFQKLVATLQRKKNVLAIFTYGSIVSGDIWDESDIDVFLVVKKGCDTRREIYTEVNGISVQAKLLNKDTFVKSFKEEGKKGAIRAMLLSSKLVFSREDEITFIYDEARYSSFSQRGNYNLLHLGKLIKDIGIIKKYLKNDGIYTSYQVLIRALDSFASLYLNMNGYEITKDALSLAMNLNDSFKYVSTKVLEEGVVEKNIEYTLGFIEDFIYTNLEVASKELLDFLYNEGKYFSSKEISESESFKDFNIKMESILKLLYKQGLVSKKNRKFLIDAEEVITENVYGSLDAK